MAALTKVTRNFQITLPEEVRQQLKIRLGDSIAIERADFGFRLHRVEKGKLEDFVGILDSFEEKVPSTELQKMWRKAFEKRGKN
ncbi:AbrB/MazE/SpoVT family DNA-binding domain-containing protein [Candidatus Woesearchaeota archaeon]|nr:AbrB/MazE/SpoVT family DNA-binding domain-containing protein [Candidatus Woesearchaeota archaeon]